MVNQIEYEMYALHHKQELMRKAQTNRTLNQIQRRNLKKNSVFKPFISWLRAQVNKKDIGVQIQSTKETGPDKELISG
jgi:hypothetical protein